MKYILLLALCVWVVLMPAGALETEDVIRTQQEKLQLDKVEREVRQYLDGADVRMENSWEENLANLAETGLVKLPGILRNAVRSCALMLVISAFCALGESLADTAAGSKSMAIDLAGTLAVSAVAVSDVNSLINAGTATIESISSFSGVLLPVVATLTAATGAITGACARQMAAVLFSSVLIKLIHSVFIPLVYGQLALNIAHTATGNPGLRRLSALFKWIVVTMLTILMMVYVGYLTLSGVVSASTDAAAVKAAKFAISGAVPVVGSILADASESVLAASGILRSSVGVFGMIAVLGICLVPFLRLGVYYLAYKAAAALSAMLGGSSASNLIESLSGVFGVILAMVGASALMLLISLVSSVMVVTA